MSESILSVKAVLKAENFQRGLAKMKTSLREFNRSELKEGAEALGKVSLAFGLLGAGAVKAASDVEKMQTSLVSLTGGTKQAADAMERLNQFTASTPFQLENVASAFRQLVAAGSSTKEATTQLGFLGDIAATTGSSINEIAAIFAKVNAKGKVELENLNQLAERGIPIFKALSEATGLPAAKLGAGAVSVEQFNTTLASFAEAGGFAAGAMERLSQTTAGKFSTALDNVKLAAAEVGEALQPVAKFVLDLVTALSQFIQRNPQLARLAGVLIGVTTAVTGLAAASLALTAAINTGLLAAFASVAAPIAAIVAGVTAAGYAVYALAGGFKELSEAEIVNREVTAEIADANRSIVASQSQIRGEVQQLAAAYRSASGDAQRQADITEELENTYSEYGIELKTTKDGVLDLSSAYNQLNAQLAVNAENLRKAAEASALDSAVGRQRAKITEELVKVQEQLAAAGVFAAPTLNDDNTINRGGLLDAYVDNLIAQGISRAEAERQFEIVFAPILDAADSAITNLFGNIEELLGRRRQIDLTETFVFDEAYERNFRKTFNDIADAHQESMERIDRQEAEGVISAKQAAAQRKKVSKDAYDAALREYESLIETASELDTLIAEGENNPLSTVTQGQRDLLQFLQGGPNAVGYIQEIKNSVVELLKQSGLSAEEALLKVEKALFRIKATAGIDKRRDTRLELNAVNTDEQVGFGPTLTNTNQGANESNFVRQRKELLETNRELINLEEDLAEIAAIRQKANKEGVDPNDYLKPEQLVLEITGPETKKRLEGEADFLVDLLRDTGQNLQRIEFQSIIADLDSGNVPFKRFVLGLEDARFALVRLLTDAASQDPIQLQALFDTDGGFNVQEVKTYIKTLKGVNPVLAEQIQTQFDLVTGFQTLTSEAGSYLSQSLIAATQAQVDAGLFQGDEEAAQRAQIEGLIDIYTQLFTEKRRALAEGNELEANLIEIPPTVREFIKTEAPQLLAVFDGMNAATKKIGESWVVVGQKITATFNTLFTELINGSKNIGETMIAMVKQVLAQVLSLVAAYAVLNVLSGGAFAAGGSAFKSAGGKVGESGLGVFLRSGGIPFLASGGMTTGPTLAMIGDNASGKEAVVPFERMGEFINMVGADKTSGPVEVYGKIRGRDIELSGRRGSADRSRRF